MISKLGNGMKKVQQLTRVQMQGLLTTYLPQNKFCTAVETLTEMKSLDLQSQSSLSNLLERDPTNPRYKSNSQLFGNKLFFKMA